MQPQTAIDAKKRVQFESFQDKNSASDWRVERIDAKSGDVSVVIFSGQDAKEMAEEYACFKNGQ